jgi:predicted metal-binding integral membrane protein DUF2182
MVSMAQPSRASECACTLTGKRNSPLRSTPAAPKGAAVFLRWLQHQNCLGCCWALFAVLVAAGVMSLAWMLLLTALVFVEKVIADGPRAASIIGLGLVAVGLGIGSGGV